MKEHWPLFPKDFPKCGVFVFCLDGIVDPPFTCYLFCWLFPLYKYRVASKWVSDRGQNRVMHAFDNIAKRCLFPAFTCNAVIKEDCPDLIWQQ